MTFTEIMMMSAKIGTSLIGAGIVFCGWLAFFCFLRRTETQPNAPFSGFLHLLPLRLGLPQAIWQATTLLVDLVASSPIAFSSCLSRALLALFRYSDSVLCLSCSVCLRPAECASYFGRLIDG